MDDNVQSGRNVSALVPSTLPSQWELQQVMTVGIYEGSSASAGQREGRGGQKGFVAVNIQFK